MNGAARVCGIQPESGFRAGVARVISGNEILLTFLAIAILASLANPLFLTETNIRNVLNQSSVLGILACAEFLVVLVGGFDLSVAAIMALSSVIFATMAPNSVPLAILSALFAGAFLGLTSGMSVTFGRVTPMIATLGVMGIARGLAFTVAEKSVSVPQDLITSAKVSIWIFSAPVLVWAAVALVLSWLLARTRIGRNLYAIGGNERAARLAGVPVLQRQIGVYVLSGILSSLAGLALVMRTFSGVPQIGEGWDLDAIAAIVIGGARLFGGEGNLLKAMVGVLIYQLISNVMNMLNLDPFYQGIIKASVIFVVVGFSVMRSRQLQRGEV